MNMRIERFLDKCDQLFFNGHFKNYIVHLRYLCNITFNNSMNFHCGSYFYYCYVNSFECVAPF